MGSSHWTHCLKPTHFLLGEPCSNTQIPHGIYSRLFKGVMFIYTSNLIKHAVFSLNKSGNLNSQRQTHCLDKRLQQGPARINTQAGSMQKLMWAHRHYIKKKSVSLELREKRFAVWALEQINSRMAVQGDQARGQGWRGETYNIRSPLPACPSSPSPLPSLWGTKVSTDNRHYVLAPILTTM